MFGKATRALFCLRTIVPYRTRGLFLPRCHRLNTKKVEEWFRHRAKQRGKGFGASEPGRNTEWSKLARKRGVKGNIVDRAPTDSCEELVILYFAVSTEIKRAAFPAPDLSPEESLKPRAASSPIWGNTPRHLS